MDFSRMWLSVLRHCFLINFFVVCMEFDSYMFNSFRPLSIMEAYMLTCSLLGRVTLLILLIQSTTLCMHLEGHTVGPLFYIFSVFLSCSFLFAFFFSFNELKCWCSAAVVIYLPKSKADKKRSLLSDSTNTEKDDLAAQVL